MTNTDKIIYAIFGILITGLLGLIFLLPQKAEASEITPYYQSATGPATDLYQSITVASGDYIAVWAGMSRYGDNCSDHRYDADINLWRSSTGATTTVAFSRERAPSTSACSNFVVYQFTGTTAETIQIMLDVNGGDFDSLYIQHITAGSGGGGGSSSTSTVYQINGNQDLFNAFILFWIVVFFIAWFFRKPK